MRGRRPAFACLIRTESHRFEGRDREGLPLLTVEIDLPTGGEVLQVARDRFSRDVKLAGEGGDIGFFVGSAQAIEDLVLPGEALGEAPLRLDLLGLFQRAQDLHGFPESAVGQGPLHRHFKLLQLDGFLEHIVGGERALQRLHLLGDVERSRLRLGSERRAGSSGTGCQVGKDTLSGPVREVGESRAGANSFFANRLFLIYAIAR